MFLLEHNIPFDVIVGVSMGSEIGASYWYVGLKQQSLKNSTLKQLLSLAIFY
jgi:predicted acylesterase/phospholipase RssA